MSNELSFSFSTRRKFIQPKFTKELLEKVRGFLEGIPVAELVAVFEGWIDRVRWVITQNWQNYSNQRLCNEFRFPIVRPWLCRKNRLILLRLYMFRVVYLLGGLEKSVWCGSRIARPSSGAVTFCDSFDGTLQKFVHGG
jgi:hypothetical protein